MPQALIVFLFVLGLNLFYLLMMKLVRWLKKGTQEPLNRPPDEEAMKRELIEEGQAKTTMNGCPSGCPLSDYCFPKEEPKS